MEVAGATGQIFRSNESWRCGWLSRLLVHNDEPRLAQEVQVMLVAKPVLIVIGMLVGAPLRLAELQLVQPVDVRVRVCVVIAVVDLGCDNTARP